MANNYTNKTSIERDYFEDRAGDGTRSATTYSVDRYVVNYTTLDYLGGIDIPTGVSIQYSVQTAATSRLGFQKTRNSDLVVSRSYESLGTGGQRLGAVVIFENGEPLEQVDLSYFDAHREGKNQVYMKDFANVPKIKPIIRISPESFYESAEDEKINHYGSFLGFGFGKEYRTVDKNRKLIPFNDFSQLIPTSLIGTKHVAGYPIVHNSKEDFFQYLDPSSAGLNGAIDIFGIRRSLIDSSISDIEVFGMFGSYQGGGIESTRKGATTIDNHYVIQSGKNEMFLDSQEVLFTGYMSGSTNLFRFKQVGLTGSNDPGSESEYLFALPGFISDEKHMAVPFNDNVNHITGSYLIDTNLSLDHFLSGSRDNISEIGSRFKSSNCGLIFGESNVLGTDSIAFGGFKK